MTGPRAQLVPFCFVRDILKESHASLSDPASWLTLINKALFQVVFNVAMTVPFGAYLRYYFRCGLKKTILLSFLLSLFFELTQLSGLYFIYPRGYRLFDVDDLMANTLGGAVGYVAVTPFLKLLPSREEVDKTSFRRGQEVSLGRRVTAFVIDIPAAGLLTVFGLTVIPWQGSYGMPLFMAYFIPASNEPSGHVCMSIWRLPRGSNTPQLAAGYLTFLPVFWRGATLGKRIMRIRVVSENGQRALWYRLLLRNICLWALLYLAPQVIYQVGMMKERTVGSLIFYGLFYGGWCFFLLFELVRMAMHRPLFYERISGTKEISTIGERG